MYLSQLPRFGRKYFVPTHVNTYTVRDFKELPYHRMDSVQVAGFFRVVGAKV